MTDDLQALLAGMVRGLEWAEFSTKGISVETPIGVEYKIEWGWQNGQYRLADGDKSLWFITLEAAQAAAQADYTARIASALNLDAVLALVAAAYAEAVRVCDDLGKDADWPASNQYERAGTVIGRRTPTDATAALARMLADARADEREKAAKACFEVAKHSGERNHQAYNYALSDAADAIRAMKGEQG